MTVMNSKAQTWVSYQIPRLLHYLVVLSLFTPPGSADGVGLIGLGKTRFQPICGQSCRRLINISPLLCKEVINGADSADEVAIPPTAECHLKDAAFMRTLALCLELGCARESEIANPIYVSTIEDYWEGHLATGTVGDRSLAMQPIRSYSESLWLAHRDISLIGIENMLVAVNGEPINQTMLVDMDEWQVGYNGQYYFEKGEAGHSFNGVAIAITTFVIPILFSMLRFLPFGRSLAASRLVVWLDQPVMGYRHRVPVTGNLGIMPTRGQSLFITYIVLTNFFLSIFPLQTMQPNYITRSHTQQRVQIIGDRTGVLATANFVALFVFSSRNNILLWLTDWSHSTFLLLHRWIGYVCIIQTVVHSVLLLVYYDYFEKIHSTESQLPYWYWGIIGTLLIILMWPAAVLPVRQKAYELFLAFHQFLAAAVLICTFLHIYFRFLYAWGYEIWVYIAGGIWFFDRTIRLLRVANNGIRSAVISLLDEDGDYLQIQVEGATTHGHVFVYFPTLTWRFWESHPFSVLSSFSDTPETSSPAAVSTSVDERGSEITLQSPPIATTTAADPEKSITARNQVQRNPDQTSVSSLDGDWRQRRRPTGPCTTLLLRSQDGATKILKDRVLSSGGSVTLPVLVESSYESNPSVRDLGHCSTLVCIAGGVGITAVLPLARRFDGPRISVHWGVKTPALLGPLEKEVSKLTAKGVVVDLSVGPRLRLPEILTQELSREGESGPIAVVVCGPGGMADECRRVVGDIIISGKTQRPVVFVDEAFSW